MHPGSALPPEPYPLARHAERALAAAAQPPAGWQPLGYTAGDYLDVVRAICTWFRACQDERGAILDPYAGEEKQYATPCYAVAAALVALDGRPPAGVWGPARRPAAEPPADPGLLDSAARAQDHALRALAVTKSTAQNHADFFAPLVVIGYQLLAPFVPAEQARRWLAELRSIDPETTYRNTFSWKISHGQEPAVHNWNVVAIAGELLRHLAGAGSALPWVARYLEYQLREHADLEWGLYRDPSCPLPYDLFPRYHLAYALAAWTRGGAGGPPAPDAASGSSLAGSFLAPGSRSFQTLMDWLHRGEWTSALTQTASGGIPPGWRSSEHLWNDAALIALAEIAAARHTRAGHHLAAGLFRRVACLAFRDLLHWRRTSGELHVVKNHFDPAQRFGFESYSFHSNYGLYPAAMLATALLFGDCRSPEAPAPVETGTYVIHYPAPFHRLVATGGGLTLAFDLDADGHYDVTGLNSVRRAGEHPLLGPASGLPAHPRYHVPEPPGQACAPGLAWTGPDGAPLSLAGLRPRAADLRVERQEPDALDFTLRYALEAGGCRAIVARYRLTPAALEVEETFEGAPAARDSLAFTWPFPIDDGRDRAEARLDRTDMLTLRLGDTVQRLSVPGTALAIASRRLAYRNGYAGLARGAVPSSAPAGTVRWHLHYSRE